MLVVEDYVEASKKLNGVCALAEKQLNDLKVRADSIRQEIEDLDSTKVISRGYCISVVRNGNGNK